MMGVVTEKMHDVAMHTRLETLDSALHWLPANNL